MVKLSDMALHINAPREMVFQMLSSIGKGSLPGVHGDSSRAMERDGDTIIAEFLTTSGKRIYRTVEKVQLYPPERITFQHLESPLIFSEEEFNLVERGDGCELRYWGEIGCRVPLLAGLGWLIAKFYVKPKYDAVIRNHMTALKSAAEARAARSHVFRRPGKR